MSAPENITRLLQAHTDGDPEALGALLPFVYEELRQIAHGRMRGERADHTLDTTGLVHEAYLRLANLDRIDWQNRSHFFAIASRAMRQVLINYARDRNRQKRRGGHQHVSLDDVDLGAESRIDDLLVLEDALRRLERLDDRQARVVECRFFGGMSIDETAHALGISTATVNRDWSMAKAWLSQELSTAPTGRENEG